MHLLRRLHHSEIVFNDFKCDVPQNVSLSTVLGSVTHWVSVRQVDEAERSGSVEEEGQAEAACRTPVPR